jgi:hypothetical protein
MRIGDKTYHGIAINTAPGAANGLPSKSKRATKVQNKIARPKARGQSLSMKPYAQGYYRVPINEARVTNQATTSTTYEANLIPESRRRAHIER